MTQFHGTLNGEPLSEKVKEARRKDFAAFPVQKYEGSWQDGMNLRDYFAAKALNGTIAAVGNEFVAVPDYLDIAKECYKFADAMMKAREQ